MKMIQNCLVRCRIRKTVDFNRRNPQAKIIQVGSGGIKTQVRNSGDSADTLTDMSDLSRETFINSVNNKSALYYVWKGFWSKSHKSNKSILDKYGIWSATLARKLKSNRQHFWYVGNDEATDYENLFLKILELE